jgi:ABC-type amino acid transport system permease subunit
MTYELECGHCGCFFTLDGRSLARSVKCPVCGGTLTVAIPVPKTPPKPTPPPPKPPAVPAPVPTAPPVPAGTPEPEICLPWPIVRTWLNTARTATDFARPCYLLFLCLDLFLFSFAPDARKEGAVVRMLAMLGAALLIPGLIHIACQIACCQVPRTHGADFARTSVVLLLIAFVAGSGLFERSAPLAVVLAVLFMLSSCGVWLLFLILLGERLRVRELGVKATAFVWHFSFGVIGASALLCGAFLAEQVRAGILVWIGQAGAGVIGFVLLCRYSALLNTATFAVDRHAPAPPTR